MIDKAQKLSTPKAKEMVTVAPDFSYMKIGGENMKYFFYMLNHLACCMFWYKILVKQGLMENHSLLRCDTM